MNKRLVAALAILSLGLFTSIQGAQAQTTDYERLYEEFLRQTQQDQTSTPSEVIAPVVTPTPSLEKAVPTLYQEPAAPETSDIRVINGTMFAEGMLIRGEDGAYFLQADGANYRVFGSEASRDIVAAAGYRVFLTGVEAVSFKTGKRVVIGISVSPGGVQVLDPNYVAPAQKRSEAKTTPAPVVQEKAEHDGYIFTENGVMTIEGELYRGDDGAYFIKAAGKALRVYGSEASRSIVQAGGSRVLLIGREAESFKTGQRTVIGIHVEAGGVQVLVDRSRNNEVRKALPFTKAEEMQEGDYRVFYGEIVIDNKRPYLLEEGNGSRILLNSTKWRMAFQHAYKGIVIVEGVLTENGGIRYSNISK